MNSALRLSLVLFATTTLFGCQPNVEDTAQIVEKPGPVPDPGEEKSRARSSARLCRDSTATTAPLTFPKYLLPTEEKDSPSEEVGQQDSRNETIEFPEYLLETARSIPEVQNLLDNWPHGGYSLRTNLDTYYRTFNALTSILDSLDPFDRERTAASLLSADYVGRLLAAHIDWGNEQTDWDDRQEELKRYGMSFRKDGMAADWVSESGLRRRAARKYTDTRWGELAFSQIYAPRTWCPSVGDVGEVEAHLEQCPSTHYRPVLILYLAQTYETRWSFSYATSNPEDYENPHDFTMDAGKYTEGADEARAKAINLYEEFLELASPDVDVSEITGTLRKLKAGIDTEQWKKICGRD